MKIDRIDVYWMRLPLAFVWKTSYADQSFTDTILVRMEGGGHYAWGESCPPFIPGYSAEHTLGTFHTLREHMVPRIIGQDIETAQDLLDRLAFIKGNQFARAAPRHRLVGARRQAARPAAAPRPRRHRRPRGGGRRLRDPGLDRHPAWRRSRGRSTRAFRGSSSSSGPDGICFMVEAVRSDVPATSPSTSTATRPTRPADTAALPEARPVRARHDRAAAGRRRHEPGQPRGSAAADRDAGLPRRERPEPGPRRRRPSRSGAAGSSTSRWPGWAGSPSRATIQSLCAEHGIPCWVGGMLESAVGGAICAELATLPNFTYAGDIFPSSYFYDERPRQARDRAERPRRGGHLAGAGHRAGARSRATQRGGPASHATFGAPLRPVRFVASLAPRVASHSTQEPRCLLGCHHGRAPGLRSIINGGRS